MKLNDLSKEGKQELALALILWRDFKTGGKIDITITKQVLQFIELLGIKKEYNELFPKMPVMEIKERK